MGCFGYMWVVYREVSPVWDILLEYLSLLDSISSHREINIRHEAVDIYTKLIY